MLYDSLKKTPFETIYDSFFARVTDDMYLEFTEEDTLEMLQDILLNAFTKAVSTPDRSISNFLSISFKNCINPDNRSDNSFVNTGMILIITYAIIPATINKIITIPSHLGSFFCINLRNG